MPDERVVESLARCRGEVAMARRHRGGRRLYRDRPLRAIRQSASRTL